MFLSLLDAATKCMAEQPTSKEAGCLGTWFLAQIAGMVAKEAGMVGIWIVTYSHLGEQGAESLDGTRADTTCRTFQFCLLDHNSKVLTTGRNGTTSWDPNR